MADGLLAQKPINSSAHRLETCATIVKRSTRRQITQTQSNRGLVHIRTQLRNLATV